MIFITWVSRNSKVTDWRTTSGVAGLPMSEGTDGLSSLVPKLDAQKRRPLFKTLTSEPSLKSYISLAGSSSSRHSWARVRVMARDRARVRVEAGADRELGQG